MSYDGYTVIIIGDLGRFQRNVTAGETIIGTITGAACSACKFRCNENKIIIGPRKKNRILKPNI